MRFVNLFCMTSSLVRFVISAGMVSVVRSPRLRERLVRCVRPGGRVTLVRIVEERFSVIRFVSVGGKLRLRTEKFSDKSSDLKRLSPSKKEKSAIPFSDKFSETRLTRWASKATLVRESRDKSSEVKFLCPSKNEMSVSGFHPRDRFVRVTPAGSTRFVSWFSARSRVVRLVRPADRTRFVN